MASKPAVSMSVHAVNPFIRYCHRFTADEDTPFVHVKPYEYRFLYVISGEGQFQLDQNIYYVKNGSVIICPPGIEYSYLPGSHQVFQLYGINFDFTMNYSSISTPIPPDKSDRFCEEDIVETVEFEDCPWLNAPLYLDNVPGLEALLEGINKEYQVRKRFSDGIARGNFIVLLYQLLRAISTSSGTEKTNNPLQQKNNQDIDEIVKYIQEHYDQPITNETIARQFNFHPGHISRLMTKYTGYPLHRYLIRYRASVALSLLQTTNKSVSDIAWMVGFTDVNYFTRCFKKIYGIRPTDCRSKGKR